MPNDQVFAGVKVLDVASFIAGPGAATVLSDFGADVIKVEPPGAGDHHRVLASLPPNPRAHANYAWHQTNRNKRGMAINLTTGSGLAKGRPSEHRCSPRASGRQARSCPARWPGRFLRAP